MKALFVKYKSVIIFILTFLLVYAALSMGYKFYLQYSDGSKFYPDYLTHVVAKQTELLLRDFGYDVQTIPHPAEPSMKLLVNGHYLARIVEGCNSISVIVLFVSFIIAFSGKLKTTFFYVLSGSVFLYVVNLLRIVLLSLGVYHFPEYADFLHSVVFQLSFMAWFFYCGFFGSIDFLNLRKTMHKVTKFIGIALLLGLLILIRFFEDDLFYDPYLTFFQKDYLYIDSPRREVVKLVMFTTLRYVLNSIISLGILFVIFKDKGIIEFSAILYALAYVLLILVYLYFVVNPRQEDYYLFFNIRRFLIQPVILILLLPAFYYYSLNQ